MIKQVATDKQYGFQWAITKDDNNLSLQDIIKNDKNQSTFKIVLKHIQKIGISCGLIVVSTSDFSR